ncbi:hypothetical protein GRI97_11325 [Altererythrobacter xixiisoli]|uniref:Uncharacterized protein n=1 Tax=Croceibacterium xixiisoli TaxID=1476466 RepID=A0A6I4TY55_9SPHN|nr:hypothetical protein [Croceibacterium xixiisoli]MXO99578.1 hypothetical protein [Croceibacterium xixiisoli]
MASLLIALLPTGAQGAVDPPGEIVIAPPAEAPPLRIVGGEAIDRLIGNTLVATQTNLGSDQPPALLYLRPDGTAVGREGRQGAKAEQAKWWIEDETLLCILPPGGKRTRNDCVGIVIEGDRIQLLENGRPLEQLDMRLEPGNPYEL